MYYSYSYEYCIFSAYPTTEDVQTHKETIMLEE